MDHDHGHDHGGGSGGGDAKSCPMIMVFHGGHCERILWEGWIASTVVEFVFSCLAIFVLSIIYEALKFLREYYLRKTIRKETERMAIELQAKNNGVPIGGGCSNTPLAEISQKTYMERVFSSSHLVQTSINFVQIILSYLLMLIFMTFNYWLCLSVVLGLTVGYFFFGWIKQDVYESECCN